MIPKPGGGERPLGIPTIRDRVAQTEAKLVLEPIFEEDLDPAAHGYRPERRVVDRHVQGLSVSSIARELGIDRKTVRKYIALGLEPPAYGPRLPRKRLIDPYIDCLRERVTAYPGLSARRLLREIRERGYAGGYTAVTAAVRDSRPRASLGHEVRFETPPGGAGQRPLPKP